MSHKEMYQVKQIKELDWESLKSFFPRRSRSAHKGNFGHVLIVGGNMGMPGSVRLVGEAALRAGAGLVSIATLPLHICAVVSGRPELMCYGIEKKKDMDPLLTKANVVLLGNGLGQDTWATELFNSVLQSNLPLVIDADGLNLLSQQKIHRSQWILTPHPGEAARMLAVTTAEIQKDRFAAIDALQHKYGGVIVLKGAGTLIRGEPQITYVCKAGNPGMASAGMGDALSGIIGGFLAQGMPLEIAAQAGVFVHAGIADAIAAEKGERGLLAQDVIQQIQRWINPF